MTWKVCVTALVRGLIERGNGPVYWSLALVGEFPCRTTYFMCSGRWVIGTLPVVGNWSRTTA